MSVGFLVYLLVGKLFIYLGMHFPPFSESKFEYVKRLWGCDLCSGVIVCSLLSYVMGEQLFREIFYFPVISELATGGLSAFLLHLLRLGWQSKFEVVVID